MLNLSRSKKAGLSFWIRDICDVVQCMLLELDSVHFGPLRSLDMNPIASILVGALILARIDGEPSMGNNGGFTLPKGGIESEIPNQLLKPFATDMVTQGVAVALLAGLGVLSGGAALSALSAQSQLQNLQGNFRTVCNAVRAAGAVDGGEIPIGPPGPPGPVGPPGPAGMDGTCSAAGGNCAEAQADINDVIARLNAVSAGTCNF